jgi:hypothetical protein
MTIDHKNNDGAFCKKNNKHPSGKAFYQWVIDNNYPDYLQVMCWNCNAGRAYNVDNPNICPHMSL